MRLFLKQEECNVICVDWEGGASMPNYLRAAANTRLVGKQLAMMLQGTQFNSVTLRILLLFLHFLVS